MKESMSATWEFQIIIIFILIFVAYLTVSVSYYKVFKAKNDIVSIIGRNGYRNRIKAQNTQLMIDKPLIVMVDGGSASASEILSGALKDYHKAKILGTRTYGKGMVQQIVPLPNGTGINLTIAKYLTPNGTDINEKGIEPDINVELTIDDMKANNDKQLIIAKKELKKMIRED